MLMKHPKCIASVLLVFALTISVSVAAEFDAWRNNAVLTLNRVAGGKVNLTRQKDGSVSHLQTSSNPIPVVSAISPEARARVFLSDYRALFFNSNAPLELKVQRDSPAGARGARVIRFQQAIRGIPIRGAEAIVHLNTVGVTSVHSKLLPDVTNISLVPTVDANRASSIAVNAVRAKHPGAALDVATPRLEIINVDQLRGNPSGESRLAWIVEVRGAASEFAWVDAIEGRILLVASRVAHALARDVEDIQGSCAGEIASYVSYAEGGTPPSADNSASPDAVAAWAYAKSAYDYFYMMFARDGINGAGANGTVMVNVCGADFTQPATPSPAVESALFDSSTDTLQFGAGMALADDIVAHEYAHAVTYSELPDGLPLGQFGAIAESYSDIFGEAVDQVQAANNDTGELRWDFGEAVAAGSAYRNLMSPHLYNMPGKVTDTNYYCGADDDVAIHVNSAVLSHAFALLVDGGTYNGLTIAGIGIDKAARIFYSALTGHLTSSSSFLHAYHELLNAADALVTAGTITADDRSSLSKAIAAVELNVTPCSAKIEYCPVGSGAQIIFRDNFESINSGNWSSIALSGVNHWRPDDGGASIYRPGAGDAGNIYVYENGPVAANSGNFALWADQTNTVDDPQRLGDSVVAMVSPVVVPASGVVRMQFEHNFDFDATADPDEALYTGHPDGSVLEYTIDAGATWIDAGGLIASGRNYGGFIGSGKDNPLATRNAFTGSTGGYVSTQLDLSSLAGRSVLFRFRMGTDGWKDRMGWLVDDVAIYSCSPPGIVVTPAGGLQTSEDKTSATFSVKLAVAPTSAVVLSISSDEIGEGVVSPDSVTFTPENWNQEQEILVTGVADNAEDGHQIYSITIKVFQTNDTAGFQSASPAFVTVTNFDNSIRAGNSRSGGGLFDALLLGFLLLIHHFFRDGIDKIHRWRTVTAV